jgi:CHAT domain
MTLVHMVTNDDAIDELVRNMFCKLPKETTFCGATIRRKSTIETALRPHAEAESEKPMLIVLDGCVGRGFGEPNSSSGVAAAEFLSRKRNEKDQIPILVVARGSLERLEAEVFRRWDVAIWNPSTPGSLEEVEREHQAFANILGGLVEKDTAKKRHITVSVGQRSAQYQIFDGHYMYNVVKEYKVDYQPGNMIEELREFSPYAGGVRKEGWQKTLLRSGRDLYNLLMEDVFGKLLLSEVKGAGHGVDVRFYVDLEAAIHGGPLDDLFLLPFEAANSDSKPESFFCARVPMARRLSPPKQPRPIAARCGCLQALFVVGASGGTVEVSNEMTGEVSFDDMAQLTNAQDVLDDLIDHEGSEQDNRKVCLSVIDGMTLKGRKYLQELENRLRYQEYDIVHFYGHSIADHRGTFLVVPGESEYSGLAVSVRAVALWISDGASRGKKLPSLVFLSSCQSASVRTAIEMMKVGIENALGFRWEVGEDMAAKYVKSFYRAFLRDGVSITESYRSACDSVRALAMGDPVWASAIAFVDD